MLTRRHVLLGSALAAGGASLPYLAEAAPSGARRPHPNIVLVLADDLGFGELGSYGQSKIATPHIDRLAAEGLRFTDAYASAAVCAPSRSSLLTGLHAGHGPVRNNPAGNSGPVALAHGDTTFAELLRARGYRTGLFGKWGFGPEEGHQPSHPNARGFDEFLGYLTHHHAHNYFPTYLWENGERVYFPENAHRAATFAPDVFRDRALDFIRRHRDEPFLLALTPNLPHAPSDIPTGAPYDDAPWPAADRGHAAQVARLDTYVGQLVHQLERHGIADDTVVIVTSDNGPHEEGGFNPNRFNANGPLKGYKRNLYEGGIRIPLIAWSPARVTRGVTHRATQQTDLLPTLAELADAPFPRDVDGRSFAPLLSGRPAPAASHLYFWRLDNVVTRRADAVDDGRLRHAAEAVRDGPWKAIRWAPGRNRNAPDDQWQVELYNLHQDIGETTDLAATLPNVARRLVRQMRASWVDDFKRDLFGLSLRAPQHVRPGDVHEVTAVLGNASAVPWQRIRITLDAPDHWTVEEVRRRGFGILEPGGRARITWRVTVPAGETRGRRSLRVRAHAVAGTAPLTFRRIHALRTERSEARS